MLDTVPQGAVQTNRNIRAKKRRTAISRRFARRGPLLATPAGTAVTFPHPIGQMLAYGGVAVVLLDAPSSFSRNVYGVDRDGRIRWRLQRSPFTVKGRHDPYLELYKRGREVRVFSWMGQVFDIEPRTGKVVGSYWSK